MKRRRNWMWIIVGAEWLALTLAALIALLTLAGCKSVEYVPVESVRDHYHAIHTTDTMLLHDSVVIDRAGDTIRETRWRDRWRVSVQRDTLRLTDTIREPYPVEVPAELSKWERTKVDYGGWAIGIVIFVIIGLIMKIKM